MRCRVYNSQGKTEVLDENFEKNLQEVQGSCFDGAMDWNNNYFRPWELSILKQHVISCPVFCWARCPKSTAKAPTVHHLRLNTIRVGDWVRVLLKLIDRCIEHVSAVNRKKNNFVIANICMGEQISSV